jgi:hypothetical protein
VQIANRRNESAAKAAAQQAVRQAVNKGAAQAAARMAAQQAVASVAVQAASQSALRKQSSKKVQSPITAAKIDQLVEQGGLESKNKLAKLAAELNIKYIRKRNIVGYSKAIKKELEKRKVV